MAARKKVVAQGVEEKTLQAYEAAILKAAQTGEAPELPRFLDEHRPAALRRAYELIKDEATRWPALVSLARVTFRLKPSDYPEGMPEFVINLLREPRWRRAAKQAAFAEKIREGRGELWESARREAASCIFAEVAAGVDPGRGPTSLHCQIQELGGGGPTAGDLYTEALLELSPLAIEVVIRGYTQGPPELQDACSPGFLRRIPSLLNGPVVQDVIVNAVEKWLMRGGDYALVEQGLRELASKPSQHRGTQEARYFLIRWLAKQAPNLAELEAIAGDHSGASVMLDAELSLLLKSGAQLDGIDALLTRLRLPRAEESRLKQLRDPQSAADYMLRTAKTPHNLLQDEALSSGVLAELLARAEQRTPGALRAIGNFGASMKTSTEHRDIRAAEQTAKAFLGDAELHDEALGVLAAMTPATAAIPATQFAERLSPQSPAWLARRLIDGIVRAARGVSRARPVVEPSVMAALRSVIEHRDRDVAQHAIQAIGSLEYSASPADVTSLTGVVAQPPHAELELDAIQVLCILASSGTDISGAEAVLNQRFRDLDAEDRGFASLALGEIASSQQRPLAAKFRKPLLSMTGDDSFDEQARRVLDAICAYDADTAAWLAKRK